MIIISIVVFILGTSLPVVKDSFSSVALARLSSILLLFCSILTLNTLDFNSINSGLLLFNGLLKLTSINQFLAVFLYLISAIIIISIFPASVSQQKHNENFVNNYYLIVLFNILGASFLILTSDLLTMFVAVELQSFSLYILASLNKDSLFSTSAGLKYFLIGSLASALILLGISIIYLATGITQFESLSLYLSVGEAQLSQATPTNNNNLFLNNPSELGDQAINLINYPGDALLQSSNSNFVNETINLAFIFIFCGLFIKLGAAPFHQWTPDVYERVPTKVTTWLVIIPKFTILIFILEFLNLIYASTPASVTHNTMLVAPGGASEGDLINIINANQISSWSSSGEVEKVINEIKTAIYQLKQQLISYRANFETGQVINKFLLITSVLSLIIGAVLGLNQMKIKRLLAYSGINHLGFLILALAVNTKSGIESFLFYLIQYTLTTLNVFLIVLAFGYITSLNLTNSDKSVVATLQKPNSKDLDYIKQFTGLFFNNPLLTITLALCLFSMAGVPPLLGFFGKQQILYASISAGYIFISIVAIVMSVISAYYYLNIIKISHFNRVVGLNATANVGAGLNGAQPQAQLGQGGLLHKSNKNILQNTHSYAIAVLTLAIILFSLKPTFIIKSLIAVTYFIFDF